LRQRSLAAWFVDDLLHSRQRQRRRAEYDAQLFPPWLDYLGIENQDYEPYSDPQFARVRIDRTTDPLIDIRWTQAGLERARAHMDALAELCRTRAIALTVVVYPGPNQVERLERESRQAAIWRAWCAERGPDFVDLYSVFIPLMAELARANRARLFIAGDVHLESRGAPASGATARASAAALIDGTEAVRSFVATFSGSLGDLVELRGFLFLGNLSLPTRLDDRPQARFVEDPLAPNTGQDTPPLVDMGAFERQP
jgi:hypothetical protein